LRVVLTLMVLLSAAPGFAGQSAQDAAGSTPADSQHHMDSMPVPTSRWSFMADGRLFATFNDQGGRRGETEVRSQNWLMLMAGRHLAGGTLSLAAMLSAEPLTAPGAGYSELFQEGEAYHHLQITDHQHPHDLFMQLAAAWQRPLSKLLSVTVGGAPVGEATLGPPAFMHRASAAENPNAPLSHHIFDSTHVANDVVMARLDFGAFSVEGSGFHGRESDERRYNVATGALDSWATRVWFRPTHDWILQASHGYLHEPEALEPGNQTRTNASASWLRRRGDGYSAFTVAAGQTARPFSTVGSFLAEGTQRVKLNSFYGRFEVTSVETEILLFPVIVHRPHPGELVNAVRATTGGFVRDVGAYGGFAFGVGGDMTVFHAPPLLDVTHGSHPISFQVFLRLAPSNTATRMGNTTMGAPHAHEAAHDHDQP
jgi:hypothetical protein